MAVDGYGCLTSLAGQVPQLTGQQFMWGCDAQSALVGAVGGVIDPEQSKTVCVLLLIGGVGVQYLIASKPVDR